MIYAVLIFTGILYKSYPFVIALLVISALGGNFFCGWFCPFGTLQEWLSKLGSRILPGKIRIPYSVDKYLRLLRYVLFLLSLGGIWYFYFLNDPYTTFQSVTTGNTAYISVLSISVLGLILFAGLFVERPFCSYLCTEGAQYGLLSVLRIFTIKRDKSKCNNCGLCDKKCPSRIQVSLNSQVRNPHCINCMECIKSCKKKSLSFGPVLPNLKEKIKKDKK
jgi:polyferredoxin